MSQSYEAWLSEAQQLDIDMRALHDSIAGIKPLSPTQIAEIHLRVHGRVTRIAHGMFSSLPDDEIRERVQQVMLKLLTRDVIERLAGGGAGPYIARMLRNAHIDFGRKRQRDWQRLAPLDEETLQDRVVEPTDAGLIVEQAMLRLTPMERKIIKLRFFDQLSIAEIAGTLGLKFSAAAKRLHRILRKLRRILESVEH